MKIAEVRRVIEGYSQDQLKLIIAQLYKALPKAIKERNDIDGLLKNPDALAQSKSRARQKEAPDIYLLKDDAESFMEDAYNQYYFAPNQFVHKRDRPKWRFIVKRLYKDILAAAVDESNVPEAAELLEKLYRLLCYSCRRVLFSGDDPFQSVGIEQAEFFRRVLALSYECEDSEAFIKDALLLMIDSSLNRYTVHEDLMEVTLEFMKTPDLKEMTIARCTGLIEAVKKEPHSKEDYTAHYEREEKLNNLAIMAFLCYARLYEYQNAISYFKANYRDRNKEVALYVLLKLLYGVNQRDYFLQEYEKAVESGINPRDSLKETYHVTKERGELPPNWR